MTTGVRFNSGRSFLVGYGAPIKTPIELDPSQFEGALVYGDDREMYFSDGEDWVVISGAPIRRPFALEPITAKHKRTLRLSTFQAAAGTLFTQTGIIFRVSLNENMSSPILFETVSSVSANSYELPSGFLPAGTTFYWEGKYLATDNQESQFSKTFSQVFPPIIETPIPINIAGENALALAVGAYESAFDLVYGSTTWEVFTNPAGTGSPLVSETNNATSVSLGPYIGTLVPGATYYWRARFNDNTTLTSAFSAIQSFVMDASFLVQNTADTSYFVGRTIRNSLNTPYQVPATVLSSDGTPYVCP
jgi:hypothetical protein